MIKRIIIFVTILYFYSDNFAQNGTKISMSFKNLPLPAILDSITEKTGYYFSYNSEIIPKGSLYSLSKSDISLSEYLNLLLTGTNISYTFYEDQIILKKESNMNVFKRGDTFTIEGWVREKESKFPIEQVNIYLNQTTVGTASLKDGSYKIENIPIGSYTIVFSHISFHKVTYDFTVDRTGKMVINSLMEIKVSELEEVEVESRPFSSEKVSVRLMDVFKRELLGSSYNAGKCTILNEEVLSFSYDSSEMVMNVFAEKPIKIENKALGYNIIYDMKLFESSPDKIRSLANIRFEELKPEDEGEAERWEENRLKAYEGSMRHFLKSLVEDNYYAQGFRVYSIENRNQISSKNLEPLRRKKIIYETEDPLEFKLDFENFLYVNYTKELESVSYLYDVKENMLKSMDINFERYVASENKNPETQKSLVRIVKKPVIIDLNGHIIEPLSVSLSGYWSWEKLADMVPIDYVAKK